MLVREVTSVAADSSGRVFCVGGATVARLDQDGLVTVAIVPGEAVLESVAVRRDGSLLVADSLSNRLLRVRVDGRVEPFAGRPQPPTLSNRARRSDGAADAALLRSPRGVSVADDRVWFAEAGPADRALRYVEAGRVESAQMPLTALRAITALAAASGGAVYVADGQTPVPSLFRLEADGSFGVVAGIDASSGGDDGQIGVARFARIGALAAAADGGCLVADATRLRRVSPDGRVETVAGAGPGFRDGPASTARFGAIHAVSAAPDGAVVVLDRENDAIRLVSTTGVVSTLLRDRAPVAPARRSARAFGAAIVDDDAAAGWAIAREMLALHRATGAARPDRSSLPVSVASARVGRRIALEWAISPEADRARLGAFCLWLIRSEEGLGAPASDADRLVARVERALASSDLTAARAAVTVVEVAFGATRRRRDRLAVAAAYRLSAAPHLASRLMASADPDARELAAEVIEQARDIRFTPLLATHALESGLAAARAAEALRTIWESPCYTAEQAAELRAGLRFSKGAVDRLVATHGVGVFGVLGLTRYRRVVAT